MATPFEHRERHPDEQACAHSNLGFIPAEDMTRDEDGYPICWRCEPLYSREWAVLHREDLVKLIADAVERLGGRAVAAQYVDDYLVQQSVNERLAERFDPAREEAAHWQLLHELQWEQELEEDDE